MSSSMSFETKTNENECGYFQSKECVFKGMDGFSICRVEQEKKGEGQDLHRNEERGMVSMGVLKAQSPVKLPKLLPS